MDMQTLASLSSVSCRRQQSARSIISGVWQNWQGLRPLELCQRVHQSYRSFSTNEPTVEETYSRKTPLEHILLRPGMYVGPTERLPPVACWTLQSDSDRQNPIDGSVSRWAMHREELRSIPALLKVFDEILVNASDNRLRHPSSCNRIDVTIDRGDDKSKPRISICNNGKSIPVQMHKKEKMYVPELLFGHLLTGSNFDDDQRRLTGGRHGYGAKLTNVFSSEFVVEIRDTHSSRGKCKTYKQVWIDNMHTCSEAQVDIRLKQDTDLEYTKITFVPDLARLANDAKMTVLPEEEYKLMRRRVVDIAGCSGGKMRVTLNGEEISLPGFEDYVDLCRSSFEDDNGLPVPPMVYHRLNSRYEVSVGLSDSKSLDSISFVNGMNTSRGGTHIDALANQISHFIADHVNTKMARQLDPLELKSPISVTPRMVKRNLMLCVNCLIENPTFDSQMKECLTTNPEQYGTQYELPKRYLTKLVKPLIMKDGGDEVDIQKSGPGIVEEVLRLAVGNQKVNMAKLLRGVGASDKQTKRQVLSIPKLEDANLAGTKDGSDCALILTEGDSAKALAVAGLEVIGRDKFGIFPLRGKFLNVRNVTVSKMAKNAELKAICSILGLQFEKSYRTKVERDELRYGHVMLMTDQDADGSHIKGLIMNLFRHFWPELLKPCLDGGQPERPFMSMFVTPLLKATRKGKKGETRSFFSMADYDRWRKELDDDDIKKYSVKYYKGLGTSTPAEAKEYFLSFIQHYRPFRWEENDGESIDMAFEKTRADDRKEWILNVYDEKSTINVDEIDGSVTYGNFVDNELIHFSNANNIRALPSVIDGLKPSQRKILHACFKRNLKDEIKVAQLAGYCAEHTAYHHGEASLHATITSMAQNFVGSNNINLLLPIGQFGTRLMGGDDAASPRYIFTHLSPVARLLFPEVDDALLDYREDDGLSIEPEFFCPVIPLLLVNGAQGIGTGWSTYIPQHNPLDVLNYIRTKLNEKDEHEFSIMPWVKGFAGRIADDPSNSGSYITEGLIEPTSQSTVSITELPVGVWTNDYKATLLKMMSKGEIRSFTENHTTTSVSFDVKVSTSKLARFIKGGLHSKFKLRNKLSKRNMNAFCPNMDIKLFETPEDIADAFFRVRLALYVDRKSVLESNMEHAAALMRNKARFIEAVSTNQVDLLRGRSSKENALHFLKELKFTPASELAKIKSNNTVERRRAISSPAREDDGKEESSPVDIMKEYDYLLNMPLSSLTTERIDALNEDASKTDAKLADIQQTTAADLWHEDLDRLESHLKSGDGSTYAP